MSAVSIADIFVHFPRIETPRLLLRQITPGDADALFATFSDEPTMEFYGELPHRSVTDSHELIRRQQDWYARREGIRWGVTFEGADEVIGSCGLFKFDDGFRCAETGYELRRVCWRQGIMSEALSAMLTFAFQFPELNRIEAVVDDANERSKALLRSLGFTHEGTLRQRFYFRDRFLDEHYFGLLRSEWPNQHPSST